VPAVLPDGLELVGAPPAEDPRDALVGRFHSLDELPEGATVGTSSLRRRSQLLAIRPDLDLRDLRGNVDTRLRKLADGLYEAVVLALAGLRRLGAEEGATPLAVEEFVPAPGQGILALEARAGDEAAAEAASAIADPGAAARLEAERAFVKAIGASCRTPVGAFATLGDGAIHARAYVGAPEGDDWIMDEVRGRQADPAGAGSELAARMLAAGAAEILRRSEADAA
jgi:hydroxymethylbilane synthase